MELGVWSLVPLPRQFPRPQRFEEGFALAAQLLFQLLRTVAIAARPRFGPVLVPAIAARMRVLHPDELEIFFPIRPFLRQRRIAKTGFDPGRDALTVHPRLVHIMNIFVARD